MFDNKHNEDRDEECLPKHDPALSHSENKLCAALLTFFSLSVGSFEELGNVCHYLYLAPLTTSLHFTMIWISFIRF